MTDWLVTNVMTAAPKPRRRKDARPGEIVAAALACFAERGFGATRLDDVAARAGVSKGTLYLYFAGKEDLFRAVVRDSVLPFLARAETEAAAFEGPTPALLERLVGMFMHLLATTRLGVIPKLVIAESGQFPDLARFYVDEVVTRGLRQIGAILRRGIARGEFRPVDVDSAVRCIVAPVLVAALWKNALEPHVGRPWDVEAVLRTHVDLLLRGLARTPGP